MRSLKDANLKDKKVLVRCDFNVSVNNKGEIVDDIRITQAMPTIKYLVEQGAKVILMSHMGRPEKQKSFQKEGTFASLKDVIFKEDRQYTLKPVYKELEKHLEDVQFINDCIGKRVDRKVNSLKQGQVLLLENLRYYEDEEKNGEYFARRLADLGDLYVNNAFSASHRDHASISGVVKNLPAYPGFLFEREVRVLSRLKEDVKRPLVVIVGGAKMASKIKTIDYFMDRADYVLLGGKVANGVLAIRGLATNIKLPSEDVVKKLEAVSLTSRKLRLPVDVVASSDPEGYLRHTGPGKVRKEETIYDIGPETVKLYSEIIREANTIVWAGPLGFFEKDNFATGTKRIAQKIVQNDDALKITGGGDTSFALKKFNLRDYIDHVSLGGGAMLTFLSDEEFPGLKALE